MTNLKISNKDIYIIGPIKKPLLKGNGFFIIPYFQVVLLAIVVAWFVVVLDLAEVLILVGLLVDPPCCGLRFCCGGLGTCERCCPPCPCCGAGFCCGGLDPWCFGLAPFSLAPWLVPLLFKRD